MVDAATVEEVTGFISGNVKRKQVLDVLDKNGSATGEYIGKLTRMPRLMLEKVLKDMTEKGVIVLKDDKYTLTESGKAAALVLPKGSSRSGGQKYDANIQREI
jgi:predicted transcriptional regulator